MVAGGCEAGKSVAEGGGAESGIPGREDLKRLMIEACENGALKIKF